MERSFAISPRRRSQRPPGRPRGATRPAPRALVDRYAAGWERGLLVRDGPHALTLGQPRLDVYSEAWLVYSMDGDIRIVHQRDPQAPDRAARGDQHQGARVRSVAGPNTRRPVRASLGTGHGPNERGPLCRVLGGLPALGSSAAAGLRRPPENIGYTYAQAEPLERTYNVVAY